MRQYVKQYTGNCPEIGKPFSITITFEDVQICGNQGGAKAVGFVCEYRAEHGCSNCDTYGRCPFIKEATREINYQ